MNSVTARARRSRGVLAGVALAGVALAGCGVAHVVAPPVTGVPSESLSVPLRTVACATDNVCVAVGATSAAVPVTAVGEYRAATGGWQSLTVPAANSPLITTSSCTSDQCLIGGSQITGDLLWSFDASAATVSALAAPSQGQGVVALSCFTASSCAMVDSSSVAGHARLSVTQDGGVTWSSPVALSWATHDTISALACTSAIACLVAGQAPGHPAQVEATTDAGATWTPLSTPETWSSLTSLTCRAKLCAGLATTDQGSALVRSIDAGATWTTLVLPETTTAVSCASARRCVLAGATNHGGWLARVNGRRVTTVALRYVPSTLTALSCGTAVCSAVGPSTLVALART
ncbi:MAG: WD40/YVTN/BNR-like repeat-containing protein [Acidimicrobiales bacterium]